MWKNVCLCKVFVLAIFALDIRGFPISKPLSREQIYIDVLKNITHVNRILNDLLNNYKHLKAIYEAQVKPHNELSLEIEVDDEDGYNKTNYDNHLEIHPVTQMILLDDGFLEESSDKSNENVDVKKNLKPHFSDNIKIDSVDNKKFVDKAVVNSNKNVVDLTSADLLYQNKKPNTELPIDLSNKSDLIVIGTALRYSENMPNMENKKVKGGFSSMDQVEKFDLNKSILRNGYDNVDKLNNNNNGYKDLKQPRKWRNPIKLSLHQDIREKDIGNHFNNKTVLLFVFNGKQKDIMFKNNRHESDSEKRQEEMLRREQLESKILRDAYGSACLKVAVRKCYKTLVQVRKLICSADFKCKHSFKDHFKSHSKVGCMSEFNYKGNNGDKQNPSQNYKRKRTAKNGNIRGSEDITRGGSDINYYELCLPVMMSEETNNDNLTLGKKRPRYMNRTEPINILRDHYEKECKRLSTEKCERACNYAIENTCGPEACARDEKKSFTRTCRQECKHAFGSDHSGSDSQGDSNSDDDSDSDDSDDSDGDSISFE